MWLRLVRALCLPRTLTKTHLVGVFSCPFHELKATTTGSKSLVRTPILSIARQGLVLSAHSTVSS